MSDDPAFKPYRLMIDGKPSTITGEWGDWETEEGRSYQTHGYDYQHDGETKTHFISTAGLVVRGGEKLPW